MSASLDALISDYVNELRRELRALPAGRRREILEEVGAHIAQARSELDSEDEAALRTVLDRLGEPSDIAAASRERFGIRPARAGGLEIVAVIVLVLPYLGWLIGTALVWMSRVWRTRDKVLTSILVAGTWVLLILWSIPVRGASLSSSGSCRMKGNRVFCDHRPVLPPETSGLEWIGAVLWVAVFVIPVVMGIYLAIRARRLSDPVTD